MPCCRICGETKPTEAFRHVTNFTKYKKHAVIWCTECQRVWMNMIKEKERMEKFLKWEQKFVVDFD